MKEIGGYLAFEQLVNKQFYNNLAFNSTRSALRFVIKKRNIKKLYMPIYLCDALYNACKKEKIEIIFYHINERFEPILPNKIDGYLLIINYYGLLGNHYLEKIINQYKNVIVDNTQSFFQKPLSNVDTIYNCRKNFGVPDGAYLETNLLKDKDITDDNSGERFSHLFGRYELNGQDYYNKFRQNEDLLDGLEIKYMSKLTHNILGAIDYKSVLKKRKANIKYLHEHLKKINKLKLDVNQMTFMYPLYLNDGEKMRSKLISKKVYVPKLWPNIPKGMELSPLEKDYIENIVFLPIDQRYGLDDMQYICKIIGE